MIRPLTCLSLVAALGAGLYLYQEKHRAQLLDRDITHTVKQAEQARDRIGLLKAEWALLNEPDRLAALAAQHLQLQPLQPTQFVRMDDLRSRLPPISLAPASPATMDEPPVAAVTPAQPPPVHLAAMQVPVTQTAPLAAARAVAAPVAIPAAIPVAASVAAPAAIPAVKTAESGPLAQPVHLAAVHPAARPAGARLQLAAKPHEAEPVARMAEPERHPLFAPVMPAYAPTPVVVHAPTVQTASVMSSSVGSFVGSALGMAHAVMAAPVPVASAATLGYATGR